LPYPRPADTSHNNYPKFTLSGKIKLLREKSVPLEGWKEEEDEEKEPLVTSQKILQQAMIHCGILMNSLNWVVEQKL